MGMFCVETDKKQGSKTTAANKECYEENKAMEWGREKWGPEGLLEEAS